MVEGILGSVTAESSCPLYSLSGLEELRRIDFRGIAEDSERISRSRAMCSSRTLWYPVMDSRNVKRTFREQEKQGRRMIQWMFEYLNRSVVAKTALLNEPFVWKCIK